MINIIDKELCVGCGACHDICSKNAISLEVDHEGFAYPKVNTNLCIDCGLCESVCPVINVQQLKEQNKVMPKVYGARNKDFDTRIKSTSGGLFSAFATYVYNNHGYVGGAIYDKDFTIKQVLSNNPEDLIIIRGSKHAQSKLLGFYKEVKAALNEDKPVLVCAAPCQIAGLRLFLRKEYDNLYTIDFLCLAVNSPLMFKKHMEWLESKYGAKVVSVQGKNKDMGWRSLAYKFQFENGQTYLKRGVEDIFTRGFIKTHCNCRPSCYSCKFKGYPRPGDISLGDFWGIENFDKSLDDNKGTSVVFVNTEKGQRLLESIKDWIEVKEYSLYDAIPGNQAILRSVDRPTIDRDQFYSDLNSMDFDDFQKKYFPPSSVGFIKRILGIVNKIRKNIGFNPITYWKFFKINFLRKNTINASIRQKHYLVPSRYSTVSLSKTAKLDINGNFVFGMPRISGSKLESRLCVEGNGELLILRGGSNAYYGCDFLVFDGAKLIFKGKDSINQNVQIICMDRIEIGFDCMISRDVVIRDNDGGHRILSDGYKTTAPVIIGDHVWIGQGAVIMKGVTIGDGAIIGAGAIVMTNVKPRSVVMADPSRTMQKNVDWVR